MAEQFYINTPKNYVTGRSVALAAKCRPATAYFRVRSHARPFSEQSGTETNSFTENFCSFCP
jgi:hypothetical protein